MSADSHDRPPTIDPVAAQRWERRVAETSPWLHEEVARRMEERLQWILREPAAWAHWSPLRGGLQGHGRVGQRYPKADVYLVESDPQAQVLLRQALGRPWWSPAGWLGGKQRWGRPPDASVGLVWSNMGLHMVADPQALVGQWRQALTHDGFVMFSALGPDTLRELRLLYQRLGWPAPAHEFTDMHDWGDMLVHSGFAEPVMDMERLVLTWPDSAALLRELRTLGGNLHPARFGALRGRGWRTRLEQELRHHLSTGEGARLELTFEIVYGHAFTAPVRQRASEDTRISLEEMRLSLRQRNQNLPKT